MKESLIFRGGQGEGEGGVAALKRHLLSLAETGNGGGGVAFQHQVLGETSGHFLYLYLRVCSSSFPLLACSPSQCQEQSQFVPHQGGQASAPREPCSGAAPPETALSNVLCLSCQCSRTQAAGGEQKGGAVVVAVAVVVGVGGLMPGCVFAPPDRFLSTL